MEKRLSVLLMGQLINQDVHDGMLKVITHLEQVYQFNIHSEQGERILTHMALAMMRSLKNETISPIEDDILNELRQAELYPQIIKLHTQTLAFFNHKPLVCEEGYLLSNWYTLFLNQ